MMPVTSTPTFPAVSDGGQALFQGFSGISFIHKNGWFDYVGSTNYRSIGFEVLIAMTMKSTVSWFVTLV
jgi:predicted ABC-type sugar transport system permease subunit